VSQSHTVAPIRKRLFSVEETADYLGISPRSIYNQIHRNAKKKFPVRYFKHGKLVKFDVFDLNEYIEKMKKGV
jgi:predicted DNA-binding transcriptional regulator AlpA